MKLIPTGTVKELTGLRNTSLYKAIKCLGFPAPCKVGRSSLWVESEVQAWLAERVAERDSKLAAAGAIAANRAIQQEARAC